MSGSVRDRVPSSPEASTVPAAARADPAAGPWLGLDGARAGWVVAELVADRGGERGALRLSLERGIEAGLARPFTQAAVDMPIGLFSNGRARPRACDLAARERLGARRASVFAPPARDMLDATEHGPLGRRGLSIQAFHLIPKLAEVDRALDPVRQARVFEAHPELAFTRLAGAPCAHNKKTAEGRAERRALLTAALGELAPVLDGFLAGTRRAAVAIDDVQDALVLALTARDAANGTAWRLPTGDPPLDARGLRMEVWG